jgi:hypothetical protein
MSVAMTQCEICLQLRRMRYMKIMTRKDKATGNYIWVFICKIHKKLIGYF